MTSWQATSEDGPSGPDGTLRAIGLIAVCLGVAALAAATFVLSYQGIRAVALQAGIEPRYARGYPLLLDAMLVIVLAAVLALRGAGLPSRVLAWLTLLVVLCAAAGADTLHATGRTLPHNGAVVTAAVLPWALVFVAFVLLLAMLRYARLRRHASVAKAQPSSTRPAEDDQARSVQSPTAPAPPLPIRSPQPRDSVSIVPGFSSRLVSAASAGAAAGAAGAAVADVEPLPEGGLALDGAHVQLADTAQTATAVEVMEPLTQTAAVDVSDDAAAPTDELDSQTDEPQPQTDELGSQTDEPDPQTDEPDPPTGDAPPEQTAEDDQHTDDSQARSGEGDTELPVFRRIRSSPTPPEE